MGSPLRVVVAGAGVTGSVIALSLAQAGMSVSLVDPSAAADNASGVAAGMLAPAFEAALDAESAVRYGLLCAGRNLWPALVERLDGADVGLRRSGGMWIDRAGDPAGRAQELAGRLKRLGAATDLISSARALNFAPGLTPGVQAAVFTPEDWSIDPRLALNALHNSFVAAGGKIITAAVASYEPGVARLSSGEMITADRLIVATGADETRLAPELAWLSPIKGQILRFAWAGEAAGPAVRCAEGYVAPLAGAMVVGATMEAGASDRLADPATIARLSALGAGVYSALAGLIPVAGAGVRAASPDGLPLVGASVREGVLLAVGMRRNGWLLAPLVAGIIVANLSGDNPGPYASALDAQRFGEVCAASA